LSDFANTKTAKISTRESSADKTDSTKSASIRVSPNSYFLALFLATFFSAYLVYLEYDASAIIVFGASWIIVPFLFWNDRIVFDGKRISRTGILPTLWASVNSSRTRLKISDIEQVETEALRALKRGGNVFYRYRTTLRGKDLQFAFASGGADYRRMIRELFAHVSDNIMDNRSIELRDYLREPKETLMKAEFAHIPSVEVLEGYFNEFKNADKKTEPKIPKRDFDAEALEKADYLHRLANELRLSGYLLQSLEAFRRALLINPTNARLLFDFARCLNSFAGSEKSEKLQRKSLAVLRLAERSAKNDGELLARMGESYFQFGDFDRAKSVFQKSIERVEESFRSVRGLAEIALREGKIAHVIHNYSTANRLAETPALRRWSQAEADYFSHLNDDDDYMDMEVSRVNLLESLENYRKIAFRAAFFGLPLILFGVITEDFLIANFGWAVSLIAFLVWVIMLVVQKTLSARIPFELMKEIEEE
jgi:tetratricopeptide (TPR) repeat protein